MKQGTLVRLGNLDEDRQQWDAAIAWHEQARRLFEALKQPANAAVVTGNIGNVLKAAKRYDQAEAAYRQVLQTYQDLGDQVGEAGISFDWAILTKTASSGMRPSPGTSRHAGCSKYSSSRPTLRM